jgi:hypothetical protein
VFLYVYFIGIYVAPLLMGVALWRSRSVPRWLAVLFFVGLEVAQQQISSGPVVILYMLPFAAAMILLAAKIWQAATLPATQPHQELTSVPRSSKQRHPGRDTSRSSCMAKFTDPLQYRGFLRRAYSS